MEWESGEGRCPAEPPEVLPLPEFRGGVSSVPVPRGDFVPAWHDMFTNLPADWGRSFRMTFRSSSLPTILGLSAVTLGLIAIDHHTYRAASRLYKRSPVVESATDLFVSFGDGQSQFLLAGAFAAYGFAASDRRAIRTASQTVEAVLATGVFIQVLKHISGRESPDVVREMERSTWRPFPSLKDYHSHQAKYYAFPSGHIATSIAALTVVADNYHDVDWIRPVGYPLVGLIGISLRSPSRSGHRLCDGQGGIASGG
jgi:membrane-associated phospholipid phosphatase